MEYFFTRQHPVIFTIALPELHRTNLVLTAGHWHRPSATNSFTGVHFDTYDNGAKKSRTEISHGLPHGVSLGWQHQEQEARRRRNLLSDVHAPAKWRVLGPRAHPDTAPEGARVSPPAAQMALGNHQKNRRASSHPCCCCG